MTTTRPTDHAGSPLEEIPRLAAEIVRVSMARQLILGFAPPLLVDVELARRDNELALQAIANADDRAAAIAEQAATHVPGLQLELGRIRRELAEEQRR